MIVIIDLDLGNIGSIVNMLKHIGAPARLARAPDELRGGEKIILPGVGSFDAAMQKIDAANWRAAIAQAVGKDKTPLLGVCLGMQMLGTSSAEGKASGLGLIDGACAALPRGALRVPHMGWNAVSPKGDCALFDGLTDKNKFYFTHAYHMELADKKALAGTTAYGGEFVSAIAKGQIFGVQFHPEKSHKYGKQLLRNFAMPHADG